MMAGIPRRFSGHFFGRKQVEKLDVEEQKRGRARALVMLGTGEEWECDAAAVRRRRRDRMTAGGLQPGGGYRRVLERGFDEAIGRK